jgi:large subunit ribosomal protein L10
MERREHQATMVKSYKTEFVENVTERLGASQSVVVLAYQGLTVANMRELRKRLREVGSELKVVKNRLTKRALAAAECDALDSMLTGPTAVAFGLTDPVGPAKVCMAYAKENAKLVVKGGLLNGRRIGEENIKAMAKMPGRQEMLGMLAGAMKAPIQQTATAMNQLMAKVAYAMKARIEQLEGAA